MGKKSGNSWLDAVKKAFRSPTNENEKRSSRTRAEESNPEEEQEEKRGKKRWIFRRHLAVETTIQHNVAKCANSSAVRICSGEESLVRKQPKTESSAAEQRRAFAAAEAAITTVAEIIRHARPVLQFKQEKAALVIQKHFRGYLARRALMALRGVVKLQAIIRGHNVRKRAKMTLQCIQSLVRVQSLVCDQRRRLSCDFFTPHLHTNNSSRKSSSLDVNPRDLDEIHALIRKAKECSLKQGKTLAHALSLQMNSGKEEDQIHPWMRKDRSLCRDQTMTMKSEVANSCTTPPPFHGRNLNLSVLPSPRTPSSSSRTRSIPCTPCYEREGHRMSMSDNSRLLPRPNYMAATASAMARVSTPRQRLSSPCREANGSGSGSAKKRLSFPAYDGHELRSEVPYYGTD